MTPGYPIFLKLENEPVLVVGGDDEAADRCGRLVACGARVTAVWPEASRRLRTLALRRAVHWYARAFTPADATIQQPSWNFRDVFFGYDLDFLMPWNQWPLSPLPTAFGTVNITARVRPGTAAVIQLSGVQVSPQLLELKASGVNASAPVELRVAIIRVQ